MGSLSSRRLEFSHFFGNFRLYQIIRVQILVIEARRILGAQQGSPGEGKVDLLDLEGNLI